MFKLKCDRTMLIGTRFRSFLRQEREHSHLISEHNSKFLNSFHSMFVSLAEGHLGARLSLFYTGREIIFTLIPIPFSCCSEEHFINEALNVSCLLIPLSTQSLQEACTASVCWVPARTDACGIPTSSRIWLFSPPSKRQVLIGSSKMLLRHALVS